MKIKDHLHNHTSKHPENMQVFTKTYETIDEIAAKITKIETIAFNIDDDQVKLQLDKINAIDISKKIIDLVNFTIEKYKKDGRL